MALTKIDDRGLTTPIDLLDDEKIRFGTTDNDLEIFHGSNISTIKDGKGDLRIMSDTIRIQRNAGGENYIYATEGGAVKLHFDGGNPKLETTASGIAITGNIEVGGNNAAQSILLYEGTNSPSNGDSCGAINWGSRTDKTVTTSIRAAAFDNTNGTDGYLTFHTSIDTVNGDSQYHLSERLRITSDGKVGIGTTSPTELLEVYSTGTSTAIEISAGEASTTTGESKLVLRSLHSSSGTAYSRSEIASLGTAGGDSDLILRTTTDNSGPQERLRIDSSGNVSIGGIAPVPTDAAYNKALLHIHQTQSGTYGSELHLTNNTTGSAAGDGMFLSMWTDNDVYLTNQEAGDINFTTNGHQALSIQSNKNVKITDGNLIIDTAGHGIDFSAQTATSATGAAVQSNGELFDHYEEGTWTPKVRGTTTAGTYTASSTAGLYTRTGDQVTLHIYISYQLTGSAGYWEIYDIPFTGRTQQYSAGSVFTKHIDTNDNVLNNVLYIGSSGTTITLYGTQDNATWVRQLVTNTTAGTDQGIIGSITYKVPT